jgi:hypothetical protein
MLESFIRVIDWFVLVSLKTRPGWSAISSSIRKSLSLASELREFDAFVGVPGVSGDSEEKLKPNYYESK